MNILCTSVILKISFITTLEQLQIAVEGVMVPIAPRTFHSHTATHETEPTSAEVRRKQEKEEQWRLEYILENERRKAREEAWRVEYEKEVAIRTQKIQEKKDAQDKIWGSAPIATTCTVGTTSVTTCKQQELCTKVYETHDLANAHYSLLVQVDDKERRKFGRMLKEHLHGKETRAHIIQQARTKEYMNLINGSQGFCVFDDPGSISERKYVILPSCVQYKRGAECKKCCSSSFVVDPVSGVHDGEEHEDANGPAGCQCRFFWFTD